MAVLVALPPRYSLQTSCWKASLYPFLCLGLFISLDLCQAISGQDIPFPAESPQAYFPERFLCNWYSETYQEDIEVYAFRRTGVVQLTKAYQFLVEKLEIDTIILVDGGTDSLMFGQEPSLGTPLEDASSIAAASQMKVEKKFLVCLGFGVDHFHGVNHYYFLKNVSELTKANTFLGAFSLLNTMEEGKDFLKLVEYANQAHEEHPSIVSNSVASAVEGQFGDYHATYRTKKSELFINPLMSLYWAFELDALAKRIKYLPRLSKSTNFVATMKIIDDYIRSVDRAKPRQLPL